MRKKYEGRDLVNVRLSSIKELNTTNPFTMWTNRPLAGSHSKENGSFNQENAHIKKNTTIRFEVPSVPG
jgi:hypothetical protein